MPSYHHDHHDHHNHHRKDGYELAQNIGRDLRHSHRPTRYIINEGKLVIDERSFDNHYRSSGSSSSSNKPNTIIYNAPGSSMWIEHAKEKPSYTECRGCFRHRERCYGGYCSECISVRLERDNWNKSRRYETVAVDDRRYVEYPERKTIGWR
ncbi:hypothetical protein HD806DRAFT_490513 [Xylariaceae sp. AK1471]|nr:hypothetical protein HD806DRAFT_490513 [Xylariaceae sp. AK1471]